MDYKAFAKAMRENKVTDEKGIILCSPDLWEEIAKIIESIPNIIDGFVYYIENKNSKFAKIAIKPINELSFDEVSEIDADGLYSKYYSTKETAERAIEKIYMYNEQ